MNRRSFFSTIAASLGLALPKPKEPDLHTIPIEFTDVDGKVYTTVGVQTGQVDPPKRAELHL